MYTIQNNIRATDTVARLGGDEFAILLPDTGPELAELIAKRIQKINSDLMRKYEWPVTLSMGVVTFARPPSVVDDLLKISDALMYSVKKNGKKDYVVLPYEEFLRVQEELEDYDDLRALREAKEILEQLGLLGRWKSPAFQLSCQTRQAAISLQSGNACLWLLEDTTNARSRAGRSTRKVRAFCSSRLRTRLHQHPSMSGGLAFAERDQRDFRRMPSAARPTCKLPVIASPFHSRAPATDPGHATEPSSPCPPAGPSEAGRES
jgi:hypothetical protein